jgi:hypothetical protein
VTASLLIALHLNLDYRTRAIKGRADYSKIIFWEFSAASNQERLQIEKYFLDLH